MSESIRVHSTELNWRPRSPTWKRIALTMPEAKTLMIVSSKYNMHFMIDYFTNITRANSYHHLALG
jgi:hypothetical protein